MKKIVYLLIVLFIFSKVIHSQWQEVGPDSCKAMTVKGNLAYALLGYYSGVWKSDNNGLNWSNATGNLPDTNQYTSISNDGTNLFIPFNQGVYKSSNNGNSWFLTSNGIEGVFVHQIIYNTTSNKLYAGCFPGLYVSTNAGNNWSLVGLDTISIHGIDCYSGNIIICGFGPNSRAVLESTNNGVNWFDISAGTIPSTHGPRELKIIGQNVFLNYGDDLYKKNISSGIWQSIRNGLPNPNNLDIKGLFAINQSLFVSLDDWNHPLVLSNNEGLTFNDICEGIPLGTSIYVNAVVAINSYALAGTDFIHPIYRRLLSEIIGISLISTEIPKQFMLSQNFPNPFNPNTNINFDISKKGFIKLSIFDILGHEVVTLVNQELQTGRYKVNWSANNFSSGIYFYKLVTDNFVQTRKMILIK